jgi:hypothetical protein
MAISRNKVKIYIGDIGATSVAAAITAGAIEGEITSYNESGGNEDVESVAAFGGFIDKEKAPDQKEVSLEIVPILGSDSTRWAAMKYTADATNAGIYTLATEGGVKPADKTIVFEAEDGTSYESIAYNNATVTELSIEHNADDNRTISMTFKCSPTTTTGVSNYMEGAVAATVLPEFSALDNN